MLYQYNKAVTHERLNVLLFASSFKDVITKTEVIGGNEIIIETSRNLTLSEVTELDSIIANYSDTDLSLIYATALDEVAKFSHEFKKHFGVKNMLRGYSPAQVKQYVSDIRDVSDLINSYALTTALAELQGMSPTAVVLQEDIDEGIVMIQKYLSEL